MNSRSRNPKMLISKLNITNDFIGILLQTFALFQTFAY